MLIKIFSLCPNYRRKFSEIAQLSQDRWLDLLVQREFKDVDHSSQITIVSSDKSGYINLTELITEFNELRNEERQISVRKFLSSLTNSNRICKVSVLYRFIYRSKFLSKLRWLMHRNSFGLESQTSTIISNFWFKINEYRNLKHFSSKVLCQKHWLYQWTQCKFFISLLKQHKFAK